MEMPVTTQSLLRTVVPAIKCRSPKLTAFQMLIRQCCRPHGQIPSIIHHAGSQKTLCASLYLYPYPTPVPLSSSDILIPYDFHLSDLGAK